MDPTGIAIVHGTVWVTNEGDGTLSQIDPSDASSRTIAIGSVPQGLASVQRELWVSVRGLATSHRGGTLRVLMAIGPPSLESSTAYDVFSWYVLHLVGDGLVAFEPVGGTNPALVPDLATSIPRATDGGRTYTFELRPGIRYSDGQVVVSSDFRRTFERGFRLDTSTAHTDLFGRLVGARACGKEPRTCDLSEGIVTDDVSGTITFHLVAPDPEFLYKLSLPLTYPVPPSVPEEEQADAGIPGTGPYMLEAPKTRERLALVRNPYFRTWAPAAQPDGYVDRIEWTYRVPVETQIEAVISGDADVAFDTYASDRLEELFVRFAARVHTSPQPVTWFVVLDNDVRPFDDPRVRRALNFALDRGKIVEALGGEGAASATCQQVPPNFPGYEPYCPYSINRVASGAWTGPDLDKALKLVRRSGATETRITIAYPGFLGVQGERIAKYLAELLDELGYQSSSDSLPPSEFYASGSNFMMGIDVWAADFPSASNFITNRFTCTASHDPSAGFCDSAIDAMIDRAIQMQAVDPASAGALWAAIDRAVVDQAPYLWLANSIALEFVSERVGNYQYHLQWAGLLNQLWVR